MLKFTKNAFDEIRWVAGVHSTNSRYWRYSTSPTVSSKDAHQVERNALTAWDFKTVLVNLTVKLYFSESHNALTS